jgi:hypothetical protein
MADAAPTFVIHGMCRSPSAALRNRRNLFVTPDTAAIPMRVVKMNIAAGLRHPSAASDPCAGGFAWDFSIIFSLLLRWRKKYVDTQVRDLSVLYLADRLK